jgi:hypothetical protein
MSGGAFVSDQLAPIKHGKQDLPWAGGTISVEYAKTAKCIYGRVLDIAKPLAGSGIKNLGSAVNKQIQALKCAYQEKLKDAVLKVFSFSLPPTTPHYPLLPLILFFITPYYSSLPPTTRHTVLYLVSLCYCV